MCFALNDLRPVAIQPVELSQIGWRMRERGRPSASTVETVHQTMRRIRRMNSGSISEKWATSTGLLREKPRVEKSGRGGSEEGCQPEEPQLCDRPTLDEDSGAGAARRIYREIGDRNSDQVDQRKTQTDRKRREALRCAGIGGAEDDQ